ncbi:hypothetical protein VP1G_03061 [Cytospora mali]|uniref:Uncharacterized protein n=1 Tax=Cytospora mali TaxID=578113 RepID=A0A194UVJ6_CYTMA|nr:hypothetical protein VP1G_03061 [Valsa mali var. pyri (nom. inval.)]
MYLSLTPTTLCEPPPLHSTCAGDSGARSLLAPFLKLLDTATCGSHQQPTSVSRPEMVPFGHEQHGDCVHALPDEIQEGTLLFLLSNPLLLCLTADYLTPSSTVNLAATCRFLRSLVYGTPGVFRHLDLSQVRSAQFDIPPIDQGGQIWRNVQLDENLTEDDFYSGPLRGTFSALRRQHILQHVSTMILDGLSVTAELIHEIIIDSSFSVRILSLRDVKNLNEPRLRAALQMAVRPSRPDGSPRLKGLYIFGAKDPPTLPVDTAAIGNGGNVTAASWIQRSHQALSAELHKPFDLWGPRHFNSPAFGQVTIGPSNPPSPQVPSSWAVATHALAGCAECGSAPEGWTVWGDSGGTDGDDFTCRFPMLAPPPMHCSNTRVASCPTGADINPSKTSQSNDPQPRFIARCMECLRDRYCWGCNKWWCEKCQQMDQDGLYYKGARHVVGPGISTIRPPPVDTGYGLVLGT